MGDVINPQINSEGSSPPKFIKDFSRQQSPLERSALASVAMEKLSKLKGQLGEAATIQSNDVRQEVRTMIDEFYQREKEKWTGTPYSKEDIKKYFSEENLSSLSMEDYILLLRRFPNEMVTNVVWQGVRDHPGIEGRLPGIYSDGFTKMLADGKLRSPFGKFLKDGFKREAIAECLGLGKSVLSKEEAFETLKNLTGPGQGWNTYADFIATHFAAEEVADHYYGAETGNEVFFAFPAAHIAANYIFSGKIEAGGGNHNDLWTWEENGTGGVKLNTGVLFIPAEAKVDPKTGSRYQLDVNNKPIINMGNINLIKNFAKSERFNSFLTSIKEAYKSKEPSLDDLNSLRQALAVDYKITDPRIQAVLLSPMHLHTLEVGKQNEASGHSTREDIATGTLRGMDADAEDLLMEAGATYKEAEATIKSQEYWDNYFRLHSEQRPNRIVYYNGDDPTAAFNKWRDENNLTKKMEEPNYGFSEHVVSNYSDPRITPGMKRFLTIGTKVINDYFDNKDSRISSKIKLPIQANRLKKQPAI